MVWTGLSKGAQLPAHLWAGGPADLGILGCMRRSGADGINRISISVRMCESCWNMFCIVFFVLFLVPFSVLVRAQAEGADWFTRMAFFFVFFFVLTLL